MKPMHIDTEDCEAAVPFLDEQPSVTGHVEGHARRRSELKFSQIPDKGHKTKRLFWPTYLNVLLFVVSVLILLKAGAKTDCACSSTSSSADEAMRYTSSWSPMFDHVDLSPRLTTVDGTLYTHDNASVYRGDPSPDTDAAWDDLAAEAFEVILVNSSTMRRAGYNPDHYFKAPSSWKSLTKATTNTATGQQDAATQEDLFPVQIDIFHQIHCLNAVRKQMHFQHYYADKFPDGHPDEMHWMHLKHCLHMVLQSLTCSADVDIVPHRWVEEDEVPFAQFGITKKCRNFDGLREWNRQNAIENVRAVWPRTKELMPDDAFVWPGHGEYGVGN
ncbi:hypothetical protein CGLO_03672 [Colletotrichum gloeosporioides Cg-14]|uniref:Tat pathway signal sequence n=1 Tax=Colletotrichum gloeosporioides (strain Cg-14) TaxID=1237896 RepID=T0M630_COLGC|nr:hypothetical protein CGLO_03672 [Colletotrichum gloeosporioides Cg-14]